LVAGCHDAPIPSVAAASLPPSNILSASQYPGASLLGGWVSILNLSTQKEGVRVRVFVCQLPLSRSLSHCIWGKDAV